MMTLLLLSQETLLEIKLLYFLVIAVLSEPLLGVMLISGLVVLLLTLLILRVMS
jgi:hypothetical protein